VARSADDEGIHDMTEDEATTRVPIVQVHDDRAWPDTGRTAPRMRFDILQIVAWGLGLSFVVFGLVAVARAGFDELALFEPQVEVGGLPATPLLGLLLLAIGVALLAAGTGEVNERGLRIGGVLLGVLGAVWMIEPAPFEDYLAVDGDSGVTLLAMAVLLMVASFLPPLSVARPGVKPKEPRR
jgi:hypothetical protein